MESELEKKLDDAPSGLFAKTAHYMKRLFVGDTKDERFGYHLMGRGFIGIPEILLSVHYVNTSVGLAAGLFISGVTISSLYITAGTHYILKSEKELDWERTKNNAEARERRGRKYNEGLLNKAKQSLDYYGEGYTTKDFYGNEVLLRQK